MQTKINYFPRKDLHGEDLVFCRIANTRHKKVKQAREKSAAVESAGKKALAFIGVMVFLWCLWMLQ